MATGEQDYTSGMAPTGHHHGRLENDEAASLRDLLRRAHEALQDYHRMAVLSSRKGGYVPTCDTPDGCGDEGLLQEIAEALGEGGE